MTTSNQKKFMKIMAMPFRMLTKGRDMYVRSMMGVAQRPRYANTNMMGSIKKGQTGPGLPKSLSTSVASSRSSTFNYENEDLRELIRANSTSSNNNKGLVDVELCLKQILKEQQMRHVHESLVEQNKFSKSKYTKGVSVPRSFSVGMGRIDEDKACEFDEEEEEEEEEELDEHKNGGKKNGVMFPRSRSHAVRPKSAIGVF